MRRSACAVLVVVLLLAASAPVSAQGSVGDATASERCSAVHNFGAEAVDVAKSADGQTVLAQLSWGFHDSVGCYLTLDEAALGVLRAAPVPESFPAGNAQTVQRCFEAHEFGASPVDVAKTADGQTVLAQVRWGYHNSIGCYLTLDETAVNALRAAQEPAPTATEQPQPGDQTDVPSGAQSAIDARFDGGGVIGLGDRRADVPFLCLLRTDSAIACWDLEGRLKTDTPDGEFKAISVGDGYACGLRTDGTIECWGSDTAYMTPHAENRWGRAPTGRTIAPSGQFKAVSSGHYHSCGLRTDDTITCWGRDETNWGDAGITDAPPGRFGAVYAGGTHSCGLRFDGTAVCWGSNRTLRHRGIFVPYGNLDNSRQATPPGDKFTALSLGYDHSCGLRIDGTITCWGYNKRRHGGKFTALSLGYNNSCGLRIDGTITCWGVGNLIEEVPNGKFLALDVKTDSACALGVSGSINCWGKGFSPVAHPPSGEFKSVSLDPNNNYACGIRIDGTITCWGRVSSVSCTTSGIEPLLSAENDIRPGYPLYNYYDLCKSELFQPPDGQFKTISVAPQHSCGLRTDGTVACWGSNEDDLVCEFSDSTYLCATSFGSRVYAPEGQFNAISTSPNTPYISCGLRSSGSIVCWGSDRYISRQPIGRFKTLSVSGTHVCGVRTDGTIKCQDLGCCIESSYYEKEHPFDDASVQYSDVVAGDGWQSWTCSLRADGIIRCWYSTDIFYAYRGGEIDDIDYVDIEGTFSSFLASSTGIQPCGVLADGMIKCWLLPYKKNRVNINDYNTESLSANDSISFDYNGFLLLEVTSDGTIVAKGQGVKPKGGYGYHRELSSENTLLGPIDPVVSSVTSESVTLTWNLPPQPKGIHIENYIVQEYDRIFGWTEIAKSRIPITTFIASRLRSSTEYRFRVLLDGGDHLASAEVAAKTSPSPDILSVAEAEVLMADLVNEFRAEYFKREPYQFNAGVAAVAYVYHPGMASVARGWSHTMATTGEFAHNPSFSEEIPAGSTARGENIAFTLRLSLRQAVYAAFDSWVDSYGHFLNMVDKSYTHLGVGIVVGEDRVWFTQNFATYG